LAPEETGETGDTVTTRQRTIGNYLRPVSNHFLLIALLVLLGLVGGLLVWTLTFGTSPYEAEALVLFKVNAGSQVDLTANPQFRDPTLDLARQQQNTVLLMSAMDVAREVQKRAAASSDRAIAALASMDPLTLYDAVHVQIKGDFVSVKADASTAPAATWLANTWADVGVGAVNKAYAEPSANVDQALQQAKSQLDADETALQSFLAENPIITLTSQISQTQSFIDSAVAAGASSSFVLYDAEQQSLRDQVTANYTITAGLNQQLNQLQALRTRVEQSPDDQNALFANQVNLMLLLNNIVAGTGTGSSASPSDPGMQLQLSLADISKQPLTKAAQLSEIDAAVKSVQGLQEDIKGQTADLEGRLRLPLPAPPARSDQSSALSPALQSVIDQQNKLQSQLEQKKFDLARLQKTRDLDQNAYDLLRSRLAEQNVNATISNIVDIGSAASDEQTVHSRSVLRSLALVVGEWVLIALALGIGLAYLLSAVRPGFSSNEALRRGFSRGRAGQARVSHSG
jgi:hypothetical protein